MLRSVSEHTGVRNDSATNLARAFSYTDDQIFVLKREKRYLGGRLMVYEGEEYIRKASSRISLYPPLP